MQRSVLPFSLVALFLGGAALFAGARVVQRGIPRDDGAEGDVGDLLEGVFADLDVVFGQRAAIEWRRWLRRSWCTTRQGAAPPTGWRSRPRWGPPVGRRGRCCLRRWGPHGG